jgi:hypothetical protein
MKLKQWGAEELNIEHVCERWKNSSLILVRTGIKKKNTIGDGVGVGVVRRVLEIQIFS